MSELGKCEVDWTTCDNEAVCTLDLKNLCASCVKIEFETWLETDSGTFEVRKPDSYWDRALAQENAEIEARRQAKLSTKMS